MNVLYRNVILIITMRVKFISNYDVKSSMKLRLLQICLKSAKKSLQYIATNVIPENA